MCDTVVALGNSTADGSVIFAKNSDRQPNEPHIIVRVPRQKYDLNVVKLLKATYIEIPQVSETYEVMLLKPSWIWGCEMGCNEFGLNIGNEAVFTREKQGGRSLIGMDMVRIALERCRTSEEAVDMIVRLLEENGQGGNCGYEKEFYYHNSFLMADRNSAWVLETAGEYWAAKKVDDIYCISNRLTIDKDFDKCHPDLVRHVVDRKWCRSEADFSFAGCYSNRLFTHFSGSKNRRGTCDTVLRQEKGNITVNTMKSILRSHDDGIEGRQFARNSVRSVCMHGGGIIGDHTTGSYIASIGEKACTYWVTGASTPCMAIFKPLWLTEGTPVFGTGEEEQAVEFWKQREMLHRMAIAGLVDLDAYIRERDELESGLEDAVSMLDINQASEEELSRLSQWAFAKENELITKYAGAKQFGTGHRHAKGSIRFNAYWKKQNLKLFGHI